MPSGKQPQRPTPPVENKSKRSTRSAPEPPDLWKLLQWVWRRFGWVGLVFLACVGIWWQWDHISKLPGIEPLVARLTQQSLPRAEPGRFNVAIAHLEGDDDHAMERVIRDSLHDKFPIVNTVSFDRLISSEQDEREGHDARGLCSKHRGSR